jgi:hypothetical protein
LVSEAICLRAGGKHGFSLMTSGSLHLARAALAATWFSYLACVLLLAGPVNALEPNKRLNQHETMVEL